MAELALRTAGALRLGHHEQPETVSRWRVARAGGVGAASGLFIGMGLFGPTSIFHQSWEEFGLFIMVGLITIIVGFSVIEPFVEWLHHGQPEHGRRTQAWYQRAAWWLVVVIAVSLFAVMEDVLRDTLVAGQSNNISGWFVAFFVSGLITYGWILGARKGPPFAALFGTLAAVLCATAFAFLMIAASLFSWAQADALVSSSAIVSDLLTLVAALANNMLAWTVCALAGGLAIDYGRGLTPSIRVLIAIVVVFALVTLGTYPVIDDPRNWVANVARALGWGAALYFYRPTDVALATRKPPSLPTSALVTLAMGVTLLFATIAGAYLSLLQESHGAGPSPGPTQTNAVAGVAYADRGHYILTFCTPPAKNLQISPDFALHVWDTEAGEEHRRLLGHTDRLLAATFDQEEVGRLISASADHTVRFWDLQNGLELTPRHFDLQNAPLITARFSPSGQWLVVATADPQLLLYDVHQRKLVRSFDDPHDVDAIAFLDDQRFVTGGDLLTLWNVNDPKARQSMVSPDGPPNAVAANDSHHLIAIASPSGKIHVYQLRPDAIAPLWEEDGQAGEAVNVAFSPSGNRLFASFERGLVALWDTDSHKRFYQFLVDFSPPDKPGESQPAPVLDACLQSDLRGVTGDVCGRIILWRFPHLYPWTDAVKPLIPPAPPPPTQGLSPPDSSAPPTETPGASLPPPTGD
ncbi:MAG TPA: hypothetical protein VH253_00455 [Phycisphaerae bacterium]|nr:hypothetical protein [Phycisphaerae bacterium]